ncbi:MAG: hypothetical protein ACKVHU_07830 [Acidimicrobiales bacterium]|jgi:cellulose synthase (UDP-forming)
MDPVAASSSTYSIAFGKLAIIITFVAWVAYAIPTLTDEFRQGNFSWSSFIESLTCLLMVTLLGLSARLYLFARHGALTRARVHRRAARGLLTAARH